MKRLMILPLLVLSATLCAQALTTAITYQGELEFEGAPAQGTFDFEFLVFDAATSGNLEATLIVEDVLVQAGLFSVELNFGPDIFIGEDRWLELGVRDGSSTGGFTGLLPRQTITPAPFALHAEAVAAGAIGSAEILDGAITADDLGNGAVAAVAVNSAEIQLRVTGTCPTEQAIVSIGENGQVSCASAADPTDFNGPDPVDSIQDVGPVSLSGTAWGLINEFTVTSGAQGGEVLALGHTLALCGSCTSGSFVTCQTSLVEALSPEPPPALGSATVRSDESSNIGIVQSFDHPPNTTATYNLMGRRIGGTGPVCEFRFSTAGGVFQPK